MHMYIFCSFPFLHVLIYCPLFSLCPGVPLALLSVKYSSKVEPHSIPSSAAEKPRVFLPPEGTVTTEDGNVEAVKFMKNNLTEDKQFDIMDVQEEGVRTEGKIYQYLYSSCSLTHEFLMLSHILI